SSAEVGGDRRRIAGLVIFVLAAGVLLTSFLSISIGATGFTPGAAWQAITRFADAAQADAIQRDVIVLDIRLPRTLLGLLIGATLAVSGVILQGLFRNPLADPGLV